MRLLLIFIISVIILAILKLPMIEVIYLSMGITLIYGLRIFLLFIIIAVILAIAGLSIKVSILTAGAIALLYWGGIILFTEHKSQTWIYTKGPWYVHDIEKMHNRVTSKEYKESALDMFFESRKRKNKRNKNLQEQDENNLKEK